MSLFDKADTFYEAFYSALGMLIPTENDGDPEADYLINECGFAADGKCVIAVRALAEAAHKINVALQQHALRDKPIKRHAKTLEDMCGFYIETSDAYDCEEDYLEHCIPDITEAVEFFEQLIK